jgi:hypothetical protein
MARARPGLEKAVNEILERHGGQGRRLSLRQAERLTGLSPATIGELAKGNARTPETIRRFALGMNEEVDRLMLLAGFVPEDSTSAQTGTEIPAAASEPGAVLSESLDPEERGWLLRFERALAKMPPGRERDLWNENLRRNTELIEAFLERMTD